jgi:hypothetical protein
MPRSDTTVPAFRNVPNQSGRSSVPPFHPPLRGGTGFAERFALLERSDASFSRAPAPGAARSTCRPPKGGSVMTALYPTSATPSPRSRAHCSQSSALALAIGLGKIVKCAAIARRTGFRKTRSQRA